MYFFKMVVLLIFFCGGLQANSLPFDLKYSSVTKVKKKKIEEYDRLQIFYNGKYHFFYGQTWYENFTYPKFEDGKHYAKIKDFFVKQLDIKETDINEKGKGHFFKGEDEYYLKLDTYANSYSYVLLKITPYPKLVSFDKNAKYIYSKKKYEKKFSDKPKNILIPLVKNFGIEKIIYRKYDETSFHYNKKRHQKNGEFWQVNFYKTSKDKNSYRYMIAHDYKKQIKELGANILLDKDNSFIFKYDVGNETYFAQFDTYNNSFSIKIIKEKKFVQSLVLSPDKIKAQLDKEGKITLDGIYFDFDKATLKKESEKAILSAVSLLEKYPDLVISIQGHTDSKGDDTYNLGLSSARAKSVKDAFIKKGIDKKRVKSKGFGESKPIASNDSDKGRAKNRRVELHKISGGNKKAIITIDFIKPIENSRVDFERTYKDDKLAIYQTKPYYKKSQRFEYKGVLKKIKYKIMKNGKRDNSFSRKEIIQNYENILFLYDAEVIGKYQNTLYFIIKDRGDGKTVYGRVSGYTGSYEISFLIEEKK